MTAKILHMHQRLTDIEAAIQKNPFATDEELAIQFNVSIHTIRADRKKIGIAEVRKRTKDLAETLYGSTKSLSKNEIIGELLEVDLDKEGMSLLETKSDMGIRKSGIIRGHILFAQANSLANAIVDAEIALTGDASVQFIAPVRMGERILAKARVIKSKSRKKIVEVIMKTKDQLVFKGQFTIYCLDMNLAEHLNLIVDDEIQGD